MTSLPKGQTAVPVWSDDDVVKALADDSGRIPVTVENLPTVIETRAHGWDGSAWYNLPMLWGYSDRWAELATGEASGSGDAVANTIAVLPGFIHVTQAFDTSHNGVGNKELQIIAYTGVVDVRLLYEAAAAEGIRIPFQVPFVLKEGDVIRAVCTSPGAGKLVYLRVWGYKMKVAE